MRRILKTIRAGAWKVVAVALVLLAGTMLSGCFVSTGSWHRGGHGGHGYHGYRGHGGYDHGGRGGHDRGDRGRDWR